jgi:hypothetical protein
MDLSLHLNSKIAISDGVEDLSVVHAELHLTGAHSHGRRTAAESNCLFRSFTCDLDSTIVVLAS